LFGAGNPCMTGTDNNDLICHDNPTQKFQG